MAAAGQPEGTAGGRARLWIVVAAAAALLLAALGVWAFASTGGDEPPAPAGPGTGSTATAGGTSTGAATGPAAGTAVIELTVAVTPTVRSVIVKGSGFGAGEVVAILVDDQELSRVNADASGGFRASVKLPNERRSFQVRAAGATSGRSATGTVTV